MQDIAQVKKGAVKIAVQVEEKLKTGASFLLQVKKDVAYIETSAHIIEVDLQQELEMFTKAHRKRFRV